MKTHLTLFIILMLFSTSVAQEDNNQFFYLHAGKKISLRPDSSKVIARVRSKAPFLRLLDSSLSSKELNETTFEIKSEARERNVHSLIGKMESVDVVYSAFKNSSGNTVYIGDEISLKLKKGIAIEQVIDAFPVEIVSKGINNTFLLRLSKIKKKDGDNVFSISNTIRNKELVEWCNPNLIQEINFNNLPNDFYFRNQYYLRDTISKQDINILGAWGITKGKGIKVAIVDDGVDEHEDLPSSRILSGYSIEGNLKGGANPSSSGHGQNCAGIVAASQNNKIGITGVAPESLILPINIDGDLLSNFQKAEAINWAWKIGGADVISCSWTFLGWDEGNDDIDNALSGAINNGRGGKGCPVVFSSGNSQGSYPGVQYPANFEGVISVGAVKKDATMWDYSNTDPTLDMLAPSGDVAGQGDIITLNPMRSGSPPTNYSIVFGGTSAACPQVAGVIALMLSVNSNLTANNVLSILKSTGRPCRNCQQNSAMILNADAAVKKSHP
jgi:serine protease